MNPEKRINVKTMVAMAMLSAIACVLMLTVQFRYMPGNEFLVHDPKDIVIVIGGFLYGPLAVVAMSIIVAFVEMVTISLDGWVGFAMNFISSCAFACPAALIYKRYRSRAGATIGLVAGWLFVTAIMLMWNYIITPVYRGFPREVVVPLLATVFLPFNLIKYGIGAAVAMLIYKPLSIALKKLKIIEEADTKPSLKQNIVIGVVLSVCFAAIPCVLLILVLRGVI